MEQIGSMLSSFTQRKTEEVSRTVATIHSQLDSSRHAVGSSFAELATLSASTAGHFQVRLVTYAFLSLLLAVPRCAAGRDQAVGVYMLRCLTVWVLLWSMVHVTQLLAV